MTLEQFVERFKGSRKSLEAMAKALATVSDNKNAQLTGKHFLEACEMMDELLKEIGCK